MSDKIIKGLLSCLDKVVFACFAGRWHHALVAIKRIEVQLLEGRLEPHLESERNLSLSHPNIVCLPLALSTWVLEASPCANRNTCMCKLQRRFIAEDFNAAVC